MVKVFEEVCSRNVVIVVVLENGMDSEEVVSKVVSAMYEEQFWILSYFELFDEVNYCN